MVLCDSGFVSFTVLNPAFSYAWDFGDGTTASGPNPSHQYNQPGSYDIQLIVMNNTGCIDTVMAQVNAFPVPQAAFDLWHGTEVYYANLSTMTLPIYQRVAIIISGH